MILEYNAPVAVRTRSGSLAEQAVINKAADAALEAESAFLAGVQANLHTATGRLIAGGSFQREEFDQSERVRAAMVDKRIFDRGLLAELPQGRGLAVRGYERRWIFGRRLRSVTIATVLAPPGPLLDEKSPPPKIGLAELNAHVRSLVRDGKAPHLVGVCSPSGFEPDVWNTPLELSNVSVVLIEPRPEGGWRVGGARTGLDDRLVKLFDPEGVTGKLSRVRKELEERRTDLLTGGLSMSSVARRLDLPAPLVRQGFEQAVRSDPELRLSRQSGDVMIYRGAAALPDMEDGSMSLADWVKSLFSSKGDEAKKIDVLSERRAALAGRLDRMYEDIGRLEKKEQQLLDEGKAATSKVSKRRLAAQIAHMRKDISRCNTSAAVISKQINIISTHIHNLELAQTGAVAQLPSSDELTEAAVNAEEILEQLAASDDLVTGLEVNLAETAVSDDEAEILKELEGNEPPAAKATVKEDKVADASAAPPKVPVQKERGTAQAE